MGLNTDFVCFYDGLINEPDEALSRDAIQARDQLRRSVVGVETYNAK